MLAVLQLRKKPAQENKTSKQTTKHGEKRRKTEKAPAPARDTGS